LGFHTPALSEVAVPNPHLATLLRLVQPLRFAVGYRPSFATMLVLVAGWVLTQGPMHCVTEALVVTDVARRRHWQAFPRFFSRGTWAPDALGLVVLRLVRRLGAAGPLRLVLDDTLCAKKGPAVFGLGSHLDAVRSTKKRKVFAFGHSWVVLAVVVAPPFSSRPWALPVLFRLYRTKATCAPDAFRKRTELARAMLERLLAALPDEPVEVSADEAYCNHTVVGGLPARVTWVGAMRPDAALTAPPADGAATGRPRKRGAPLPKPKELAADAHARWQRLRTTLYGRARTVQYKTRTGVWWRVCGPSPVRVVVVKTDGGAVPFRVFFCTDVARSAEAILRGDSQRWSIEVLFGDLKQLFGFADSPARSEKAVLRTAPFVGLVYSLLVVWFAEGVATSSLGTPPERPWYPHKKGLCFADVLRAAQRALRGIDVLELPALLERLEKGAEVKKTPANRPLDRAA
jgi:hypothetical protein